MSIEEAIRAEQASLRTRLSALDRALAALTGLEATAPVAPPPLPPPPAPAAPPALAVAHRPAGDKREPTRPTRLAPGTAVAEVLEHLRASKGTVRPVELCKALELSSASVSNALKKLVDEGHVERVGVLGSAVYRVPATRTAASSHASDLAGRALDRLAHSGTPMTMGEIARGMSCSPERLVDAVQELVKSGRAVKIHPVHGDGRTLYRAAAAAVEDAAQTTSAFGNEADDEE